MRFKLPSNVLLLGIEKILPCFHCLGIWPSERHRLNRAVSEVMHVEFRCLIILLLIPVEPQALPFGSLAIVWSTSSSVMEEVSEVYQLGLI